MYTIFSTSKFSEFYVIDIKTLKRSGWNKFVSSDLKHPLSTDVKLAKKEDVLEYLQKANPSVKIQLLGDYNTLNDFYIDNPHLLI